MECSNNHEREHNILEYVTTDAVLNIFANFKSEAQFIIEVLTFFSVDCSALSEEIFPTKNCCIKMFKMLFLRIIAFGEYINRYQSNWSNDRIVNIRQLIKRTGITTIGSTLYPRKFSPWKAFSLHTTDDWRPTNHVTYSFQNLNKLLD